MKPKLKIYLAGPMRGQPMLNFPTFNATTALLRGNGHTVFNPAEGDIKDGFDPATDILRRSAIDRQERARISPWLKPHPKPEQKPPEDPVQKRLDSIETDIWGLIGLSTVTLGILVGLTIGMMLR